MAATVLGRAGDPAAVIVGTGHPWWKEQITDFGRYVESLGAAAVMVLRPQAASSDSAASEEEVFELYREVSEALECATVLHGRFSMPLLKRLAALPGVGAAKEDAGDAWCHDALWAVGDHLPILGSGPTERPVRGCQGGRSIRQSVFRICRRARQGILRRTAGGHGGLRMRLSMVAAAAGVARRRRDGGVAQLVRAHGFSALTALVSQPRLSSGTIVALTQRMSMAVCAAS